MRKRFIISLVIMAVMMIAGVITFGSLKSKTFDVTITSHDSLTEFTIEKMAGTKPKDWSHAYGYVGFELESDFNTFDKALHSDYFAFTIDDGVNIGKKYGDTMVFLKDGHYFAMLIDDDMINARLVELISVIVANDAVFGQRWFYFTFPFVYHRSFSQYMLFEEGETELNVPWCDTLGMHSFDDVKTFYTYTGADYFMIDEEEQAVLLKFYEWGGWTDRYMMRVQATEEGLTVTPTQDFLDYLADADRESSWFHNDEPMW